tara:strand:- start:1456 stop:1668 length:213 start_codon:yes stop_codon:yes gene_type:complete
MVINIETEEVDWDTIISAIREINRETEEDNSEDKKLICKKCKLEFFNKNYNGNYPLCDKHRNNTFKGSVK